MDSVITWVLEANTHFQTTGDVLEMHYVPSLMKYNQQALKYEREFLTLAIALWGKLPRTVTEIFPVNMHGQYMYMLITFNPVEKDLGMPEAVTSLTIDQFIRPSKKVLSAKQSMKNPTGAA
jgi:hypothetical protein